LLIDGVVCTDSRNPPPLQVGETIKALVLRVDHETGRLSLSTKKLEQQPGDLLNLSREEFFQRAEEQHVSGAPRSSKLRRPGMGCACSSHQLCSRSCQRAVLQVFTFNSVHAINDHNSHDDR
jgi:transcriptional accessory protein Tex/SPT6